MNMDTCPHCGGELTAPTPTTADGKKEGPGPAVNIRVNLEKGDEKKALATKPKKTTAGY